MDSQRKETNVLCSSPPYVDPLVILDGNYSINPHQISIPYNTRLDYSADHFKKSVRILITLILIIVLLSFSLYQIVLGCFNCGFEDNNLGWIRASFILSTLLVLGILIYVVTMFRKKKTFSLLHVFVCILAYQIFFGYYTYGFGIYFEVNELSKIQAALTNDTIVSTLPCPTSYYHQVYVVKLISWSLSVFFLFLPIMLRCRKPSKPCIDNAKSKYNAFAIAIVRRWIDLKNIIFSRHAEEIVLQRF